MTGDRFEIAGRPLGKGAAPFLIAEVGINHGGKVSMALRMIEAAAKAGADAVKLQTFDTMKFLSRSSEYFDVLRACELPRDGIVALAARARELGITLFSACFDEESANLWHDLDAPAFKIASGDITHLPLLRHIAAFGKPMIVSTGGTTMEEIAAALRAIRETDSAPPIALLHCVSNYPTKAEDANLACMAGLRAHFGCPVGFSDHTEGTAVAIAAAALGAELVEKHFTLDRGLPGPDHAISAEPEELAALARALRMAQAAVGRSDKMPVEAADFIPLIRRSVTAAVDIPSDTPITRDMLAVKRPGTGIAPDDIEAVIGRRAARDLVADETMRWSDLG
jgi:N-acetylneuraminate synthase/N,N'-diacetyllegionaminate synthase